MDTTTLSSSYLSFCYLAAAAGTDGAAGIKTLARPVVDLHGPLREVWLAPWLIGKGGDVRVSPFSFFISLHFRRLMIGVDVPVSVECHPDKSNRHQDGSSYHQPMWILHR